MPGLRRWITCTAVLVFLGMGCGKPVTDAVQEAGADDRAAAFQHAWLARMITDARENFNPETVARDFSRLVLDPSRLILLEPTNVRVYFVAAQGGFRSALGYWVEGPGVKDSSTHILFPNATSPRKMYEYADALKQAPNSSDMAFFGGRRAEAPLLPGDFIDLGMLPKGTKIVFFLVANAVKFPQGRFTTIPEENPDKLQHVVTIAYQDSPYLMMGFEDLMGGGDRTFNDVVFTVELSKSGIAALGDAGRRQEVDAMLWTIERWKILRARIALGLVAGLVLGGPFFLWALRRHLRRRRIRRTLALAQEHLESGNPRDALRTLRAGQGYAGRGLREQWAGLEMQACKQSQDAAQLDDLFTRFPGAVLQDERASLLAARAQLEAERDEPFQTVRNAWNERESAPGAWLLLESDWLVRQEKARDAEALLRRKQFTGTDEGARLARLAERVLRTSPAEAEQHLARALQLAPKDPEVHQSRARILEAAGRMEEAGEAWRTAITFADDTPYLRDHYAEFLVRRGEYARALSCWREVLRPPTADILWIKAFFWERVTAPAGISWSSLEKPSGSLRPLLDRLLELPEDRFWRADTLDVLIPQHPEYFARPECFWLRALQSIRDRREDTVLALLSTSRSDTRHYFDTLETALRQTLTYRRMQFLHPNQTIIGAGTPPAWAVPLFQRMDAWARGTPAESTDALAAQLMGPRAFAELFRAIGWRRAADGLDAPPSA